MTYKELHSVAEEMTEDCTVYIFEDKANAQKFFRALSSLSYPIDNNVHSALDQFLKDKTLVILTDNGEITKSMKHSSIGFYKYDRVIYALLDCNEELNEWAKTGTAFVLPEVRNVNMKYLLNMK